MLAPGSREGVRRGPAVQPQGDASRSHSCNGLSLQAQDSIHLFTWGGKSPLRSIDG